MHCHETPCAVLLYVLEADCIDSETIERAQFQTNPLHNKEFSRCTFRFCDFSAANLGESEFSDCVFHNVNLKKADFTGAYVYEINPQTNDVRRATFSMPHVVGLLSGLDILIKD